MKQWNPVCLFGSRKTRIILLLFRDWQTYTVITKSQLNPFLPAQNENKYSVLALRYDFPLWVLMKEGGTNKKMIMDGWSLFNFQSHNFVLGSRK